MALVRVMTRVTRVPTLRLARSFFVSFIGGDNFQTQEEIVLKKKIAGTQSTLC